jgi:micrococcal nuclease
MKVSITKLLRLFIGRRRTPSLIMAIVFVLTGLLLPRLEQLLYAQAAAPEPGFFYVAKVYDGDTIGVEMAGSLEKIRMIGVDTPETHKPHTPPQCYGAEASRFTTEHLLHKTVRLTADPETDNRDRYDRLLRFIYTENGELWNQKLIAEGYAPAYTSFPFTKSPEFVASQETARAQHIGLWATCTMTQASGRWQSNAIL